MWKAIQVLVLFFIVVMVTTSSAFSTELECKHFTHCESSLVDHDSHEKTSSHGPMDCHCPVHNHSCNHSSAIVGCDESALTVGALNDEAFNAVYSFHFLSPYIEAPFQPPRA